MEMYNKPGSKKRLVEMMQGVNKVKINEDFGETQTLNVDDILNTAIVKLSSGALDIEKGGTNRSVMQTINGASYVGINGYDRDKNMYNFNFKITGSEDDQDGVFNIENVILERFYFQNPDGNKVIELDENELRDFNNKTTTDLYDIIEKYIDVDIKPGEEFDELNEGDENIGSQPYGGSNETFQTGESYVDEKPINPKLRVKTSEIDNYLKENDEIPAHDDLPKNHLSKEKTELIKTAYENLTRKKGKPEYAPTMPEMQDEISRISNDKFMNEEDNKKFRYEEIVTMQGEEAVKPLIYLARYNNPKDVIEYFIKYHKPGEHSTTPINNFGSSDITYEMDGYTLSWNLNVKTLHLVYDTEYKGVNENVDDDVDTTNQIEGGIGDENESSDFDPKQVLMGMEVEMEHTNDPKIALEITIDHLTEFGDYYTRLEKMENGAENEIPVDDMKRDNPSLPVDDEDTKLLLRDFPELQLEWESENKKNSELEDEILGFKPLNVGDTE